MAQKAQNMLGPLVPRLRPASLLQLLRVLVRLVIEEVCEFGVSFCKGRYLITFSTIHRGKCKIGVREYIKRDKKKETEKSKREKKK